MAQAVSHGLSSRRPRFASGSVDVGYVVKKLHWNRFFSEFFGVPSKYHSTVALHI
jgi:hypothetical protein